MTEGAPIVLQQLTFHGLDSLPDKRKKQVTQDLPLRVGKPFNLARLQWSIDTVSLRLRNLGYPTVDIFREFMSDSATRTASATLTVETGHHFSFGSVKVEGTARVDTSVVRSLLVVEAGAALLGAGDHREPAQPVPVGPLQPGAGVARHGGLRQDRLAGAGDRQGRGGEAAHGEGQRRATPRRTASASAPGFGLRNFLGSGRILDISARASKIGVASSPGFVDWNLENSLCPGVKEDGVVEIGSRKLNYNVTVSVRRPAFLSPQNSMTLSGFSERRSEYSIYLREDIGAGVALTRESPVRATR